MPHTLVVAVHLVLIENSRALLGQRADTTFASDHWHAPARKPDKCDARRFRPLAGLPQPITGHTADEIAQITAGRPRSVAGRPA